MAQDAARQVMRLQKFLAQAGVGSRRHCEDVIRAGRVHVDGLPALLGSSVDPARQRVTVDGVEVGAEAKEYWLLNKPLGVISTASDPQGRPTVVESVPSRGRVFPVGRLDGDSSGVIILTNDGDLTARLLHPRYEVEKEYIATVRGDITSAAVEALRQGVALEDGPSWPAEVEVLHRGGRSPDRRTTTLRVVIHEGRKRQVRRMLEAVGHRVISLHRRRFGAVDDGDLPLGHARPLSDAEVRALKGLAED